jgi:hypothetical protein
MSCQIPLPGNPDTIAELTLFDRPGRDQSKTRTCATQNQMPRQSASCSVLFTDGDR